MCDPDRIDIELFIMEVAKRACLWNIASEEYKDRTKKDTAWQEICNVFYPSFPELPEKEKKSIGK